MSTGRIPAKASIDQAASGRQEQRLAASHSACRPANRQTSTNPAARMPGRIGSPDRASTPPSPRYGSPAGCRDRTCWAADRQSRWVLVTVDPSSDDAARIDKYVAAMAVQYVGSSRNDRRRANFPTTFALIRGLVQTARDHETAQRKKNKDAQVSVRKYGVRHNAPQRGASGSESRP